MVPADWGGGVRSSSVDIVEGSISIKSARGVAWQSQHYVVIHSQYYELISLSLSAFLRDHIIVSRKSPILAALVMCLLDVCSQFRSLSLFTNNTHRSFSHLNSSKMSSVTHAYKFGLAAMAGLGAKSSYDSHRKIARTGSAHGGAEEMGGIPGTLGRCLTRKNTNGSTSSCDSFDSFQEEIKRIQCQSTK